MVDVLRKQVSYSFDKAIAKVEQACKEEGFGLLLTKNIDEIFKKKFGLESYPRYTFILACAPELAKAALEVSKDVGTLFPCSFVVCEDEGKIFVMHASIMKAAAETGLAPKDKMAPVIEMTGERVHRVWDKI
jgi:uncharacterized protein (DUF302 family)